MLLSRIVAFLLADGNWREDRSAVSEERAVVLESIELAVVGLELPESGKSDRAVIMASAHAESPSSLFSTIHNQTNGHMYLFS